jgi:hypothetical protein
VEEFSQIESFVRLAQRVERSEARAETPDLRMPYYDTPMVGDGMAGSRPANIREPRRGQAVFMAPSPEEPPGGRSQGVRSSGETGNTVEPRDAGKWRRDESEPRRKTGDSGDNAQISRLHCSGIGRPLFL